MGLVMLQNSPLGQKTAYVEHYDPKLLYPVPRALARDKLKLKELPFNGADIWNAFELSWLNEKGKPQVAMAEFVIPCTSPYIVESKSFKLYLNSFNQSQFASWQIVQKIMENDLSQLLKSTLEVQLYALNETPQAMIKKPEGICLDHLDITTNVYEVCPYFLKVNQEIVEEKLYSELLKSNCMATGQPDWGNLYIHYKGPKIDHDGLLKYIVSFRRYVGFAEHCVEQIYCDLMKSCSCEKLTVYARYTKRGGLDINPFRSNFEASVPNSRDVRQ